jgi:hypothetical protein
VIDLRRFLKKQLRLETMKQKESREKKLQLLNFKSNRRNLHQNQKKKSGKDKILPKETRPKELRKSSNQRNKLKRKQTEKSSLSSTALLTFFLKKSLNKQNKTTKFKN